MRRSLLVALAAAGALAPAAAAADTRPLRLLFSSNRTGTHQLYSVNPSGRDLRQLTFGARTACSPVPSPNGRLIAFLVMLEPSTRGCLPTGEIWAMSADGQRQWKLAMEGGQPSWSRDSRRVAYSGGARAGPIFVVNADGSGSRLVTREEDWGPSWSRDGRSMAFIRGEPGSLVVRRGTVERSVAEAALVPAWSPDGRWIAYAQHRDARNVAAGIAVVRADGRGRRLITRFARSPFGLSLKWSPDGRRLAFFDAETIKVATVATRTVRTLARVVASELAWTPSGDALVYAEARHRAGGHGGIGRVTLGGKRKMLAGFAFGTFHGGVSWSRPPSGVRSPAAEPISPLALPRENELQLRAPVEGIAADGDRVLYSTCGYVAAAWRPGGAVVPVSRYGPNACEARSVVPGLPTTLYSLALAGDRTALVDGFGGNIAEYDVRIGALGREPSTIASGFNCCASEPLGTYRMGWVLGDGALLVFSSVVACGDSPPSPSCGAGSRRIVAQSLWRVREPGLAGSCAGRAGPCELLASAGGAMTPLALDAGRVVVRDGGGSVRVLAVDGQTVRTVPFAPGQAIAAELAGDDLIVLLAGELRHYRVSTGALARSFPVPRVRSGGFCGIPCGFPPPELRLEDAARGLVVYIVGGQIHVLRLADGADRVVAAGEAAELDDAGLFYAYRADGPRPGRIRFVTFSELPLGA